MVLHTVSTSLARDLGESVYKASSHGDQIIAQTMVTIDTCTLSL